MRTVIRRRIRVEAVTDETKLERYYYRSGAVSASYGERQTAIFGPLPRKHYRVEFRLSTRGRYRVTQPCYAMQVQRASVKGASVNTAYVCFLPQSWLRKRISRRVLPW